jgi:ubiquinone biosynthesis protein
MKTIKRLLRLIYINIVLARNGLDTIVTTLHLFRPFRFVIYLNPWNWFRKEPIAPGVALRKSLEELGPIFVKFGQALSTRPDVLPADIAFELSKLQDKVPPFSSETVLSVIDKTFGCSAFELFASFDANPLASASMAQVHAATLKTGEEVVVKVLRPRMREIIELDLSILYFIAQLAERFWSESDRVKPKAIVREFEYHLLEELDLQCEAANAAQLKRNFDKSPLLYVPEIHWNFVRKNILVMERIYGIPVSDVKSLEAHNINYFLPKSFVIVFFMQTCTQAIFLFLPNMLKTHNIFVWILALWAV